MLKIATKENAAIVIEMFNQMIKDSRYKYMFGDYVLTESLYEYFTDPEWTMNNTLRVGLLIENPEGEIIGFTAFEKVPCMYTTFTLARVVVVYIKEEYRKNGYMSDVLEALEFWGKKIGCQYANVGVSTENTDLTSKGYDKYEVMYMKELS